MRNNDKKRMKPFAAEKIKTGRKSSWGKETERANRKSSRAGHIWGEGERSYEGRKKTIIEQLSTGLHRWVSGEDLQDALLWVSLDRLELFPWDTFWSFFGWWACITHECELALSWLPGTPIVFGLQAVVTSMEVRLLTDLDWNAFLQWPHGETKSEDRRDPDLRTRGCRWQWRSDILRETLGTPTF